MHRSRLLSSTINVSFLRLIGQFVALFSGLVIANYFGATAATDDYYTALILPAALANLIINVLTNLFAPIYLQYVSDDPDEGPRILSSMMFVVSLALLIAIVISLIAVPLYTSSRPLSSDDAVTRALIFGFVLVLNCPLIGYTRLLGVYSETHQRYSGPAAAAILTPVVFITVLLLTLSLGIYSLLMANLFSTAFELLVLTIFVRRSVQLRLMPAFSIHPAVREMLRLSFAPGLAFLAMFLVPTIDRTMAASLDPGSLTTFHYGERIIVAFEVLVLGGPLLVIYYHWADVNAKQGIDAVAHSVPDMISLLSFVLVPVCVGGALLSYPIISILFGRGAFTAVEASASVFAILLLSTVFNFLIVLAVRLMLLIQRTDVQLILSLGVTLLNVLLNIALIVPFGLYGIPLSTLITRAIIVIVSSVYLKRYFPSISFRTIGYRLSKTLLNTAVMAATLYMLQSVFADALRRDYGLLLQIGVLALLVVCGAVSYIGSALITRHADLVTLVQVVRQTRYGAVLRRIGIAV